MKKKWWRHLIAVSEEKNIGYLLLRLFIGVGMMTHGYGKFFGGPERWKGIGMAMGKLGINFLPTFWGFMAAFAEFFGGIFLVLGIFTPVFSFLIFFTMLVAAFFVHGGDSFSAREGALCHLFPSLLFMLKGAGRYSLDFLIFKSPGKRQTGR